MESSSGGFKGVITAATSKKDVADAVDALFTTLDHPNLGSMLFFCSAEYDLPSLATEMDKRFGSIPVAGCTTAGEITPDGYTQGSITAIGFDKRSFAVNIGLINRLEDFTLHKAETLVYNLLNKCQGQSSVDIKGNTFAITLLDGLSALEEQVLETLTSVLGEIPSFGGAAGDNGILSYTHVFSQGSFYTDAAIIILITTTCPFEVFSTHHLKQKTEKLIVTEADSETRTVYEFNGQPAAQIYADTIGVRVEDMDSTVFALNPIGVIIGEECYIRSVQKVNVDQSLTFHCAIENGIVLTVLESMDILQNLGARLSKIKDKLGDCQVTIGFDCYFRRVEIEHLQLQSTMSELLKQSNVIGFNTYGEHFAGMFLNQTFVGVGIGHESND